MNYFSILLSVSINCLIICLTLSSETPPKKVMELLKGKRPTIPRIVGGQTIKKLEFPWMLSLQYEDQHFCGATLISPEWAVTAAHCVDSKGPKPFEVVCGAHSLSSKREPNERRLGYKIIISHEKWNSTVITDDIALIRLNKSLDLEANDKHIKTIDLPPDNIVLHTGELCTATGWGLTNAENDKVSDLPQKVVLPLVSQQECSRNYGQQTRIFRTNICAGGSKGRGICNGDSGGPLNCYIGGKWTFAGLDSFTVPCAIKGYPSVFTRIDRYNQWIRKKIAENDLF